jgi:hypothetical protein
MHGTNLKLSPDHPIEEHENVEWVDFGKPQALSLLKLIEPFLMDKISSGSYRIITNDLRGCLNIVTNVFPEPPLDNRMLNLNQPE